MKNLIAYLCVLGLMSSCSLMPAASPPLTQHDLGGSFAPLTHAPLPLRTVTVSAAPVLAGLSMQYRTADQPTILGVYAYHRWAATPASLVDQALTRLLPLEPSGRCRLSVQLSDFVLELDEKGQGAVFLAGALRLSADGKSQTFKRIVDIRIPIAKAEPGGQAQGLRQAVISLADQAADWMSGDIDQFCR